MGDKLKYTLLVVIPLVVVAILFLSFKLIGGGTKSEETVVFDKRLINEVLIKALDGGSDEEMEQFYSSKVNEGVLSETVVEEFFDFEDASTHTFWGRYDIGADKTISVRLNELINDNEEGLRTYLTVMSYKYLIDREDLGHDYSGQDLSGDLFYRVNKVFVVAVKDGAIVSMTTFPEGSLVGNKDGVGYDIEDKHLFEEGILELDSEKIKEDLENDDHE